MDTIVKLSHHILKKAEHPAFPWIVFFLTILESIFLFIPPEVFMAPPIIANKKRAIPVTIAAAVGSLIGGAISYMIGLWLFDSVGIWLVENFATMEKFAIAQEMFKTNGALIIFISAFSPIPYKLLAVCAGFMGFPALVFLGLSSVFRTARFAIVGFLLWKFQAQANTIIKKYFWQLTIAAMLFALIGIAFIWLF